MSYSSAEEIWNEVRRLVPEVYGGISYSRLDQEGGLQYPCPTEDHPGTKYLHDRFQQEVFYGPKAPFKPVDYVPPKELPDQEFPFLLTTGRRYESYNTHTQTSYYADGVKLKQTDETVDMNETDAARMGVEAGDWVQVTSRRGTVKVKVKITDQVPEGLVFMSFHFNEVPTNVLTIDAFDPVAGTAEYKACAVKIEKL
ncbi:hypothetical protein L1765_03245 [Microaerobacter geothermalis]|nr:molybdopterin dinucleotide binding domain-containing protein [Microaerobacter geothermalis]MCF6093009.1 hypothetical protein [Microaerobacter geothermalis]